MSAQASKFKKPTTSHTASRTTHTSKSHNKPASEDVDVDVELLKDHTVRLSDSLDKDLKYFISGMEELDPRRNAPRAALSLVHPDKLEPAIKEKYAKATPGPHGQQQLPPKANSHNHSTTAATTTGDTSSASMATTTFDRPAGTGTGTGSGTALTKSVDTHGNDLISSIASMYSPRREDLQRSLDQGEAANGTTAKEQVGIAMDISKCQSDIIATQVVLRKLSQSVVSITAGFDSYQSQNNAKNARVMEELYAIKSRQDDFSLDMSSLTIKVNKIVSTHNKNNSKSNELYNEVSTNTQQMRAQHEKMKKWVQKTVDDVESSHVQLSAESKELRTLMDGSFEYTLSKVEKFFEGNAERERKCEVYFQESHNKLNNAMAIIREFDTLRTGYGDLMAKVDALALVKQTSERLIKKLNLQGFDEAKPISFEAVSRKLSWVANLTNVRVRLQLLKMSCVPLSLPVIAADARPTSEVSLLPIAGTKELAKFRLELGEHLAFPEYLGMYIYVDALPDSYPLSLEHTVLTFLGKTFSYSGQDMCVEPSRGHFKCLISFDDAARLFTSNSTPVECDVRASRVRE